METAYVELLCRGETLSRMGSLGGWVLVPCAFAFYHHSPTRDHQEYCSHNDNHHKHNVHNGPHHPSFHVASAAHCHFGHFHANPIARNWNVCESERESFLHKSPRVTGDLLQSMEQCLSTQSNNSQYNPSHLAAPWCRLDASTGCALYHCQNSS